MPIDFHMELDPEQYRAVSTTEGPVLIIAGAGSGKTRVITYRIAWLLSRGVPQEAILALTFTNKAAKEMAERARDLVKLPLKNLEISTFHSFGASILRKEISRLGWRPNFSIYDESDRIQAVKDCARELGFAMESFDAVKTASLFSSVRSGSCGRDSLGSGFETLFEEYRRTLKIYNAVDFDDLIATPIELFSKFPELAKKYRERFRYIMVDEFQDTSMQQYEFISAIAGRNICVVGDDDQSIYSWRGADIRNMERLEKDHPDVAEIKLERNYRSTPEILGAANAVISHNAKRKKKELWSPKSRGGVPIAISSCDDDSAEADEIVETMKRIKYSEHLQWDSFGILVRTNSQARVIEERIMEAGVPYRTAGGPSFYQRREVRDMLAYLRAAANPDDDVSVLRIINVPRRGIGKASLEKLVGAARAHNLSVRSAAQLSGAKQEILDFFDAIEKFRDEVLSRKKALSASLRDFVNGINYWRYLLEEHKSDDKTAAWKYRNIELLAASIERWEKDPDTLDKGLFAYLNRVALVTRDDPDDEGGKASLLTIHSAKGLEFDSVFIPGCEEGILPHSRSVEEGGGDIEEERRLFYVALTRARRRLFLSYALSRRRYGQVFETKPSQFLEELPAEFVGEEGSPPVEKSEEEMAKDFFSMMKAKFA